MAKEKIISTCDKIIEWCFYALIIAVTFSTSLVEVLSSLMILAWLIKKNSDRDFSQLNSVPVKLLALFLFWNILSCINSGYFKESFRGIFKWLEYSLLFVIAATSLDRKPIARRSFYTVIVAVTITCLNGIYQYFAGVDLLRHRTLTPHDYLRRISSSFVHPNDLGSYILIASVILIAFILLWRVHLKKRLLLLIPFVISMAALYLTKSRGAWMAFIAAVLTLGALINKKTIAAFLAILLVVFIMLPYSVQEHIFSLADAKSGTTWERLMLWKGTINMIREHPLLGFGVNTYSRNFPKFKPPEYPDVRYTHNSYLHMAAEIGIPGILLYLIFLVSVLMFSLVGIYRMADDDRKVLAIGLFAGLVGFTFNCVVDTHLYSVNLAVLFHLLLGFCFAISYHAQK